MLPTKAEGHANPKYLLRYTAEYSDAPHRIATFVQEQGDHVKALLRAHLRRRGHVQVTCLLEYQKEAPRRSLHLKRRGCRRRLPFSQDAQAHPSKMSSSSVPCLTNSYRQGLYKFFGKGYKLLHNSSRAGHLAWCDFSGICSILPNKHIFRKYIIFSLLANVVLRPRRKPHRVSSSFGSTIFAASWHTLFLGDKTKWCRSSWFTHFCLLSCVWGWSICQSFDALQKRHAAWHTRVSQTVRRSKFTWFTIKLFTARI